MSVGLSIALALFAMAVIEAAIIAGWRSRLTDVARVDGVAGSELPGLTLVVPMRDEETNITMLLQDLYAQDYPRDRYEVLVIDDGSTDGSAALVKGIGRTWPALRILRSSGIGKKSAIADGVRNAAHGVIVLTDADTRCGPTRLMQIGNAMRARRVDLLIAPVWTEGSGFLGGLQESEQAALLGMAMGTALQGTPTLAYGANLAFRREAFDAVGGFERDGFASGDDHFLLNRMRANRRHVEALWQPDAIVTTMALSTWRGFFDQRLRWAGKMRGAMGVFAFVGLLGLIWPWALFATTARFTFIGSMGQQALYQLLLLLATWLLWIVPIVGLVRDASTSMRRPASSARAVVALLCFSAYAPVLAIVSQVVRPRWKGRRT